MTPTCSRHEATCIGGHSNLGVGNVFTLASRKPLLSHTVANSSFLLANRIIEHDRRHLNSITADNPLSSPSASHPLMGSLAGASRAVHDGLRSIPDWRRLTGASRTSYFSLLLQYIPDGESDHQRQRLWLSTSEVSASNTPSPLLLQRWLTFGLPRRRAVTAL